MNPTPIKVQVRRECFEELSAAQRSISEASRTLGAGNEHVREKMVEAQRALSAAVGELWRLGVIL